jgi:hypothetical protein
MARRGRRFQSVRGLRVSSCSACASVSRLASVEGFGVHPVADVDDARLAIDVAAFQREPFRRTKLAAAKITIGR